MQGTHQDARLVPGTVLDSYRVVHYLASGKTGDIYEVAHTKLSRSFALKLLHPALAQSPEAVQRFLREGKVAGRLEHPNIVTMHDLGVFEGRPYLIMELLAGETLATRLGRGAMPLHDALGVALPLVAGLATAHAAGVVHRDLKPDNVMLVPDPEGTRPVIMDFGVSKLFDGIDLTNSSAMLGTPVYMAPEQLDSAKRVDARAAQFALSALLYEMLCGRRRHPVDTFFELLELQVAGQYTPLGALVSVPEELSDAVERALDREPANRFASISAFGSALLPFAELRARKTWEGVLDPTSAYKDTMPAINAEDIPGPPPGYVPPSAAPVPLVSPSSKRARTPALDEEAVDLPTSRAGLWILLVLVLVAAAALIVFLLR